MRPALLTPLFADLSKIKGVGPKLLPTLGKLLGKQDHPRIIDLILHMPFGILERHEIESLKDAESDMRIIAHVNILSHDSPPRNSRRPFKVLVGDEEETMDLIFFGGDPRYITRMLPVGQTRIISGKVQKFNDRLQMAHPESIQRPDDDKPIARLEPAYPLTKGVSRLRLRQFISNALGAIMPLPEWIEPKFMEQEKWPSWQEAILKIHTPKSVQDALPESSHIRRLSYDEILSSQLALALSRRNMVEKQGQSQIATGDLSTQIKNSLPFSLTNAQQDALKEIEEDMAKPAAMLRLLQGDVGSGKTLVALLSACISMEAGHQVALMAPTDILARQHYKSIRQLAEPIGIKVGLLVGSMKAAEKREMQQALVSGEIDLIIGTHALFQDAVSFQDLGLIIVDEQHRFGVLQRLALANKGAMPDVLVMTATPIPRTLVMAYFGDITSSQLNEKPAGRQPIITKSTPQENDEAVIARMQSALDEGKQAYWVCPLVAQSEELDVMSVEERFDILKSKLSHPIALLHGQMPESEKQKAMQSFIDGKTRLLIATTVIEVGVDVPNASIIVIENAERFGLSQLHQLRGRVGRGSIASSCLLLHSNNLSENGKARMDIMCRTENGFVIAEEDLRLRGEGEVLGRHQSGQISTKIADMSVQYDLIQIARQDVKLILETDPELKSERGKALKTLLYLFERDEALSLIRAG